MELYFEQFKSYDKNDNTKNIDDLIKSIMLINYGLVKLDEEKLIETKYNLYIELIKNLETHYKPLIINGENIIKNVEVKNL